MIVGFVGFKQVGKSTAAQYLHDKYGFARVNFKDALVREVCTNFPNLVHEIITIMEKEYWEGKPWTVERLIAEKPPLFRALLQNYGTEVRRHDNENYWVSQWKVATYKDTDIVVDDVRFINEALAVRSRGGILVRLTRPDLTTGGTHASEVAQTQIVVDHTIDCALGDKGTIYKALDNVILAA